MSSTPKKSAFRRSALPESHRRGAVIPLLAVLMVVFLAMVAFAVDIAYMELARTELRVSTDAAARAAGEALTRLQDLNLAKQAAKDVAAANMVAGKPLLLDDSDIIFGRSAYNTQGAWVFDPNGTPVNSVQVRGRRTQDSPSGSVPLFFGSIFNVRDFEPVRDSTVVRQDRDVCLVVDRSSSMKLSVDSDSENMSYSDPRICRKPYSDSRWKALEEAVRIFNVTLGQTPQTEYVGLVSYASAFNYCYVSNAESTVNQTLTSDLSRIDTAMSGISNTVFNGNTNIAAGINHGVSVLTGPSARPFSRKTMILLTDGIRTEGGDPVQSANTAAVHDIVIHTITYGDAASQSEMRAVAHAAGGTHYHAPDKESLENIFRELALSVSVTFVD